MSRLSTVAPFLLGFAILSSPSAAGCREDPRKVGLGEEAARLKAYNCSVGVPPRQAELRSNFIVFRAKLSRWLSPADQCRQSQIYLESLKSSRMRYSQNSNILWILLVRRRLRPKALMEAS